MFKQVNYVYYMYKKKHFKVLLKAIEVLEY